MIRSDYRGNFDILIPFLTLTAGSISSAFSKLSSSLVWVLLRSALPGEDSTCLNLSPLLPGEDSIAELLIKESAVFLLTAIQESIWKSSSYRYPITGQYSGYVTSQRQMLPCWGSRWDPPRWGCWSWWRRRLWTPGRTGITCYEASWTSEAETL